MDGKESVDGGGYIKVMEVSDEEVVISLQERRSK